MNRRKSHGGLAEQELQKLEADLITRGFVKAPEKSSVSPGQYSITSYTGNMQDFGSKRKFNIEWME